MKLVRTLALVSFTALFVVACSSSDIGESCDAEGSTDDCVDNAVCQKNKAGAAVCAKICKDKVDCPSNADCEGVSGSNMKACRI